MPFKKVAISRKRKEQMQVLTSTHKTFQNIVQLYQQIVGQGHPYQGTTEMSLLVLIYHHIISNCRGGFFMRWGCVHSYSMLATLPGGSWWTGQQHQRLTRLVQWWMQMSTVFKIIIIIIIIDHAFLGVFKCVSSSSLLLLLLQYDYYFVLV